MIPGSKNISSVLVFRVFLVRRVRLVCMGADGADEEDGDADEEKDDDDDDDDGDMTNQNRALEGSVELIAVLETVPWASSLAPRVA